MGIEFNAVRIARISNAVRGSSPSYTKWVILRLCGPSSLRLSFFHVGDRLEATLASSLGQTELFFSLVL